MKRVRLITEDEHNGKEAISRTPLRNKYFFEGAWHEVNLKPKAEEEINGSQKYRLPEILRDAQIIEATEAIFAEMPETFDIRVLTNKVDIEMYDCNKRPREATIDRQLRQLRQYGKLNYEVVDDQKGLYRKLAVKERVCAEQKKIDFKTDWEKRFVEFLKEEGVYKKYVKLLTHDRKEPLSEFLKRLEKNDQIDLCVSGAFPWPKKDVTFWSIINEKWRAICDGKN